MKQYSSFYKLGIIDEEINGEDYLSKEIFVGDSGPVSTGLVDKNNQPIYCSYIKPSVGFLRF